MDEILAFIVAALFPDYFSQRWSLRRARKRLVERKVKCFIRVADGRQSGLVPSWMYGDGFLEPGRLTFTPLVDYVGIHRIPIISIDFTPQRRPVSQESRLPANLLVWELVTPSATLEWAVLDKLIIEAAEILKPRDGPR